MTDIPFDPPSTSPDDEGSLAGVLRSALDKFLQGIDDTIPARVVAFDAASNRVEVQPLVMMGTTDGRRLSRARVASVPVFRFGAGGGMLYTPIAEGDLGWLKATDRDLSLFLQSLGEAWPNTRRFHSFQDAFFIPDAMRRANPTGDDADRLVLSWEDGSRVVVGEGVVEVHGTTSVRVVTPLATIEGDVRVTGALVAEGGLTGANGLRFETHRHLGVQTGGGTSQGPTP